MYKEYNNCLISFFSFSELFPAINWPKEIGNLISIWCWYIYSFPFLLSNKLENLFNNIYYFIWVFGFFSCSLISSISSFKTLNPLLIKATWIVSFLVLFSDLFNLSSNAPRSWTLKCFVTNPSFMPLFFRSISLSSL